MLQRDYLLCELVHLVVQCGVELFQASRLSALAEEASISFCVNFTAILLVLQANAEQLDLALVFRGIFTDFQGGLNN